jgi:uncharacterized protein (TIGR03435 family)
MTFLPGGRFEARKSTIEDLARVAYGFEDVHPRGTVHTPRFFGLGDDKYDITAATGQEWSTPPPGEVVPPELRSILRVFLADRFELEARVEVRKVDVYALRLARADREPGPGLSMSGGECQGPYTLTASGSNAVQRCPFRLESHVIQAGAVTMPEVARLISRISGIEVDRVVVDQTGLLGTYDLTLTIDLATGVRFLPNQRGELDRLSVGTQSSSLLADRRPLAIRQALEQQLGLKLEKAELPIPTLIIEGAKRPVDD